MTTPQNTEADLLVEYSETRRRLILALGYCAGGYVFARSGGPLRAPLLAAEEVAGPSVNADVASTDQAAALPYAREAQVLGQVASLVGQPDTVIASGRVIDPETGFDSIADCWIKDGQIVGIFPPHSTLDGEAKAEAEAARSQAGAVIDAREHVVAPGFIDLLSYEPNEFGVWLKLLDGVTSNLAMHGVNNFGAPFFDRYEGVTPLHFGGAFHHHFVRGEVMGVSVERALSDAQQRILTESFVANAEAGFAGISFSPEYSPGVTTEEMEALAAVATSLSQVCFFHVRHSDPHEPGTGLEAVDEVLGIAKRTGASVHIEHLTSTGGTWAMEEAIERIEAARSSGLDVTACMYPYDYWATYLSSARFAAGWQERYSLDYGDLQVAGEVDRLDETTYVAAAEANRLVVANGSIPPEDVSLGLRTPWMIVSSDAILTQSLNNHPRGAGTFSRLLGKYVREDGVMNLVDALRRVTILPAQRLEAMIPEMRRKGRIQVGADADIVVFDPRKVIDVATVQRPAAPSEGFSWVLVDGEVAVRDGVLQRDVFAGMALKSAVG